MVKKPKIGDKYSYWFAGSLKEGKIEEISKRLTNINKKTTYIMEGRYPIQEDMLIKKLK